MRHNTKEIEERVIVALDLGSDCITAMAAKVLENSQLQIIGIEQKMTSDVQYGVVKRVSNTGFNISTCLKLLQNRANIKTPTEVFIAVGGHQLKLHEVSAKRKLGSNRLVSEKVLEEMMNECREKVERQQGIKVYSVTPLYFTLDQKIDTKEPKGATANEIEGFYEILVGPVTIYENTDRTLERTGFVLAHAPLKHESVHTALLNEEDQKLGTAIIDLGAETSTLTIYKENRLLCYYSIPLGGKHITRDIQSTGVSLGYAEKLKCKKGVAMESLVTDPVYLQVPSANASEPTIRISTTFLAQIIEARLKEIVDPLLLKLREFEEEIEGMVLLTGGGSMLEGITTFIQQYTHLQVGIGSHIEWLTEDTDEAYYAPNFSQLVGTVIIGDTFLKTQTPNKKTKEPKVPRARSIVERFSNKMLNFFEEGT